MNIDLFVTDHGEAGLIIDRAVKELPSGAILDAETNFMTLEFAQSAQTMHLNIPVEEDHKEKLLFSPQLHVAMMDDGLIAEHRNIVLLYLNDPYGGEFGDMAHTGRAQRSILRLEQFMKRCTFAQAINRVDVGDEGTVGSVLQGVSPKSLQFSKQLAREMAMDAGHRIEQTLGMGITQNSGPKGPGGMGGGSTTRPVMPQRRIQRPPEDSDTE